MTAWRCFGVPRFAEQTILSSVDLGVNRLRSILCCLPFRPASREERIICRPPPSSTPSGQALRPAPEGSNPIGDRCQLTASSFERRIIGATRIWSTPLQIETNACRTALADLDESLLIVLDENVILNDPFPADPHAALAQNTQCLRRAADQPGLLQQAR